MILDSDENLQGYPITLLSNYLAHYMLFANFLCYVIQYNLLAILFDCLVISLLENELMQYDSLKCKLHFIYITFYHKIGKQEVNVCWDCFHWC